MSEKQTYMIQADGIKGENYSRRSPRNRSEHWGRTPNGGSPECYSVTQYRPKWELARRNKGSDQMSHSEVARVVEAAKKEWGCRNCQACGGPSVSATAGTVIKLAASKPFAHVESMSDAREELDGKPCQRDTTITI